MFGGCAFEKYPNKHNEYKHDDKAFLFQLHPNQVMLKNRLDEEDKEDAIRYYHDTLSCFGAGVEIDIYEPKNGKKSKSNNPGRTYEMPPGCNDEQAKSYLAGSK